MDKWFFSQDIAPEDLGHGSTRKVLAHSGTLMMVEIHCQTGAEGAAHTHPHEQETYIVSGVFEFTNDGETRTVRAGDSIRFAPGVKHGTRCLEAGVLLDVFTPARADFLKK